MPVDRLDFEAIDERDINELVSAQVPEGLRWDFKRDMYGNADADKREALKDISSFANSSGGHLIIGVEEAGGLAIGVPGIAGVDPDEIVQRLDQLARGGLEPRIQGVRIKAVALDSGSHCFVVRVPKSWHAPHRVSAHNSNRYWLRNSAGCHEPSVDELRALFNLSGDAIHRVFQFRDQRIADLAMGRGARPLQGDGRLILHIVPLASVTARLQVDIRAAHERNGSFRPISTTGYSPRFNLHGFINERGGELNHGYTQLYRDGKIEATKATIWRQHEGGPIIPAIAFERWIFEVLAGYVDGLRNLDVAPPLVVLLTLDGVLGARYAIGDHHFLDDPGTFDQAVVTLPECYIDEYGTAADYQRAMRPAFDTLWNSAGAGRARTFNEDGSWAGAVVV